MQDFGVFTTPCSVCIAATATPREDDKPIPHHLTIESLFASVREGCLICSAVSEDIIGGGASGSSSLAFVSDINVDSLRSSGFVSSSVWSGYGESKGAELLIYNNTVLPPRFQSFFFEIVSEEASEIGRLVKDHEEVSTSDEYTWDKIQNWVTECTVKHDICSARALSSITRPSRLLYLGHADIDRIYLRSTNDIDFKLECYIALSHRWRDYIEQCRLTTKNIDSYYEEGIKISSLPQTFQDTVTICRRLQISYLWIDALCIVQDSKEDWLDQSTIMNVVYQGAFLTVVAIVSATSLPPGIFQSHPKNSTVPCLHRPTPSSASNTPITYRIRDGSIWVRKVLNSPLSNRGWTLQERLLSRRSLYFTPTQVFWECVTGRYSESDTQVLPFVDQLFWYPENFNAVAAACHTPSARWNAASRRGNARLPPQREALAYWGMLLNSYSKCTLTVAIDKLVAVSGLARIIKPLLGSDYVAGLWRNGFPGTLCWEFLLPSTEDIGIYRAPTWSWAKTDGKGIGMSPNEADTVDLVDVLHVHVQHPQGVDEFGPVDDGWIVLRGRLAAMEWGWQYEESQNILYHVWAKIGDEVLRESLFCVIRPDSVGEMSSEGLVCCPIIYGGARFHALVLRACEGVYKRVGILWAFYELDFVKNWFAPPKNRQIFEDYDEVHDRYHVKII